MVSCTQEQVFSVGQSSPEGQNGVPGVLQLRGFPTQRALVFCRAVRGSGLGALWVVSFFGSPGGSDGIPGDCTTVKT